jgi:hypothetical protein
MFVFLESMATERQPQDRRRRSYSRRWQCALTSQNPGQCLRRLTAESANLGARLKKNFTLPDSQQVEKFGSMAPTPKCGC